MDKYQQQSEQPVPFELIDLQGIIGLFVHSVGLLVPQVLIDRQAIIKQGCRAVFKCESVDRLPLDRPFELKIVMVFEPIFTKPVVGDMFIIKNLFDFAPQMGNVNMNVVVASLILISPNILKYVCKR